MEEWGGGMGEEGCRGEIWRWVMLRKPTQLLERAMVGSDRGGAGRHRRRPGQAGQSTHPPAKFARWSEMT